MNDVSFNKELKKIAHDLQLLWNPERKLWGVYQVRNRSILVMNADIAVKPWLLFDITTDDGQFRLPDQRDLTRAAKSAYLAHALWDKGGDYYSDKFEAKEAAKEEAGREKNNDTFRQAAKEIAKSARGTKTTHLVSSKRG